MFTSHGLSGSQPTATSAVPSCSMCPLLSTAVAWPAAPSGATSLVLSGQLTLALVLAIVSLVHRSVTIVHTVLYIGMNKICFFIYLLYNHWDVNA
jgi:hypothetical protein